MASQIFNEEGLLKKNVLRGSSLRGRFEDMAAEAGVEDLQFTYRGLKQASDQIKTYRAKQLADALDLNERVGARESERSRDSLLKRRQEEKSKFSEETAAYREKTGNPYAAISEPAAYAKRQEKKQENIEKHKAIVADAETKIKELTGKVDDADAWLSEYKAKLEEKKKKAQMFAALDNFTNAYVTAREANIGREELLYRLGAEAGSRAAQVETGLTAATDMYNKSADTYNNYVAAKDRHKAAFEEAQRKLAGHRQSNLWHEAMAKHPGMIITKGSTPAQRKAAQKMNRERFAMYRNYDKSARSAVDVIRDAYDVDAWRLRRENTKAGMQYI